MSTMVLPFQVMVRRPWSVTVATTVASRFSWSASSMNRGVLGFHHHGHPLLGFADGKLGAVRPSYFFGDLVEGRWPGPRPADGHRDPVGAEVVAALNQAGGLRVGRGAGASAPPGRCPSAPPPAGLQEAVVWDLGSRWPCRSRPSLFGRPGESPHPGGRLPRRTLAAGAAAITAPISMRLAA